MENHLIRDKKTGAVINTNVSEYELYKIRREQILKTRSDKNEVEDLKLKVETIASDLSEIKQLLLLAIEKK